MKKVLLIAAFLIACVVQAQSLVGVWGVDGEEGSIEFKEDMTMVLDVPNMGEMPPGLEMTYFFDGTQTPAHYDMIITMMGQTEKGQGIIEFIDDDHIKLYMPANTATRPTAFPEEGEPGFEQVGTLTRLK